MMEVSKLKELLPFYDSGMLSPNEKAEIARALLKSKDLKKDLEFWRQVRQVLFMRGEYEGHGHPDAKQLVKYVERTFTGDRAELERHLQMCDQCKGELELIEKTYPDKGTSRPHRAPILNLFPTYIKKLRPVYALPIAAILLVALLMWNLFAPSTDDVEGMRESAGKFMSEGKYGEAEDLLGRALAVAEQNWLPDDSRLVEILDQLAIVTLKQGKLVEAESLFFRVLASKEMGVETRAREVGLTLAQLSELRKQQGDIPGSRLYAERAKELLANQPVESPAELLKRQRSPLQRHAALTLVPQIVFRGPTPGARFPVLPLDDKVSAIALTIIVRHADLPTPPFKFSLVTPDDETIHFPDELDPVRSSSGLDTIRVSLDRTLFSKAGGRYQIRLSETSPAGPDGLRETKYSFEVRGRNE